MHCSILSIIYHEPHWESTKACIEASGLPVHYVERNPKGTGSLAEAINRGIKEMPECDYVWIVTNVMFSKMLHKKLIDCLEYQGCAAVHPCFDSDHQHLRQDTVPITHVPFVEFTAPMVRKELLHKFPLDEKMPYVGFDMDWGYRLRRAGYKLGCYHGEKLGHIYNRHLTTHPVTHQRRKLRMKAIPQTRKRILELYGRDYKTKLHYNGPL